MKGISGIFLNGVQYITVEEAAKKLKFNIASVRRLIMQGAFSPIMLGHSNLIKLSDVEAYKSKK